MGVMSTLDEARQALATDPDRLARLDNEGLIDSGGIALLKGLTGEHAWNNARQWARRNGLTPVTREWAGGEGQGSHVPRDLFDIDQTLEALGMSGSGQTCTARNIDTGETIRFRNLSGLVRRVRGIKGRVYSNPEQWITIDPHDDEAGPDETAIIVNHDRRHQSAGVTRLVVPTRALDELTEGDEHA